MGARLLLATLVAGCGEFTPSAPLPDRDLCQDAAAWEALKTKCEEYAARSSGFVTGHMYLGADRIVYERETERIMIGYGNFGGVIGLQAYARTPYYKFVIGAGTSVSTAALETSTESLTVENLMYSWIDVSNGPETLRSHQSINSLRHEIDLQRRTVRIRTVQAADQKSSAVCICGAISGSERITNRIEDIRRN